MNRSHFSCIDLPQSDFRFRLIKEFLKADRHSLKYNLNFKAKKILDSKQKNEKVFMYFYIKHS